MYGCISDTSEGNTLWQKERLLNIALDNLPHSVEKVHAIVVLNYYYV